MKQKQGFPWKHLRSDDIRFFLKMSKCLKMVQKLTRPGRSQQVSSEVHVVLQTISKDCSWNWKDGQRRVSFWVWVELRRNKNKNQNQKRNQYRGRSTVGSSGLHQLPQHLKPVSRQVAQWAGGPLAHMLAVHRQGHAHLADGQVDLDRQVGQLWPPPASSGPSQFYFYSHLVKAAVEQPADLRLVEGQLLHLPPVVQTEVQQLLGRCWGRHPHATSSESFTRFRLNELQRKTLFLLYLFLIQTDLNQEKFRR